MGKRKPKGIRQCRHCGADFEWHPEIRVMFCSTSCSSIYRCLDGRASRVPWVKCAWCSLSFVRHGRWIVCSQRCSEARVHAVYEASKAAARLPRTSSKCRDCGVAFLARLSAKTPMLYCSKRCAVRFNKCLRKHRLRTSGPHCREGWMAVPYLPLFGSREGGNTGSPGSCDCGWLVRQVQRGACSPRL